MSEENSVKLTPPDVNQCQAMKPTGESFMTLGGKPELYRCTNKPIVIVKEVVQGSDGRLGSMSLCQLCLCVMHKQCGLGGVSMESIGDTDEIPS